MPQGGLVAISVTPLTDGGAVDASGMQQLMDFYVACGATGVSILGVMGEANRMTDIESKQVVDLTIESLAGRVPVIVGVSNPSLARMADLADHAMAAGAAGVMVQPTPGLQGDATVAGYFGLVAQTLGGTVPICVQDFPKANGVHISPGAWETIVGSNPSIVMLKAEDEPGLSKLSAIRQMESEGLRSVTILTGNNGILLPYELGRGADGAMTGFAFPDVLAATIQMYRDGRRAEATALYDAYLPVNRYELRLGIAMRKEILRRRGAIRSAACRAPVAPLDPITAAELDVVLARLVEATGALSEVRTPA